MRRFLILMGIKKNAILCLLFLCCGLLCVPASARAQEMTLDSVSVRMRFPDPWLVVTPASLPIYAGILQAAGMDTQAMEARFVSDGVVAEGWSEDYTDSYRLMVREDERSATLFDIGRVETNQRRAIAASFTDAEGGGSDGLRYQEAEWQSHSSMGDFLFLRYNQMEADEIVGRGVQYFTIRNGRNYIIDWFVGARRVTNRDLARFREILEGFIFTRQEVPPPLPAMLEVEGGLPQESGDGVLRLTGVTEPEAGLILTRDNGAQGPEVLSVGTATRQGTFRLNATLTVPGDYALTLTATKEGYADTRVTGQLRFEAGMLPINIDGRPNPRYTEDTYPLTGQAPSGTQLQVLDGTQSFQRRVGSDGRFSVKIDTSEIRAYDIMLVATLKGHLERRIGVSFERVRTEADDVRAIKEQAEAVSYANLTRNAQEQVGKLVVCTGKVMEVEQGAGVWFLRLDVSRTAKQVWQVVVTCDEDPQVGREERITCYGRVNEPFVEYDASENETIIPSLTQLLLEKE